MPSINYTDALAIALYTLSLFWLALGITILLERRRQLTLPYYFTQVINLSLTAQHKHRLPPAIVTQEIPQVSVQSQTVPYTAMSRSLFFQEREQSPLQREGTPEQIVIHIEPDGLPTDERRNIQRIIDHLQSISR
ncbi:MAG: hypothetical protein AAF787_06695 [Chloroflexota bacterium]